MTASSTPAGGTRVKSVSLAGTQRISLGEEGILVETRDPLVGVWSPSRQIYYDEIRALYTFKTLDWAYLVPAALYAVVAIPVLVLICYQLANSAQTWFALFSLTGTVLLALTVYRIFVLQIPMIALDCLSGPYSFSTRDKTFVPKLLARLPLLPPGTPHPTPAPAVPEPAPEAWAVDASLEPPAPMESPAQTPHVESPQPVEDIPQEFEAGGSGDNRSVIPPEAGDGEAKPAETPGEKPPPPPAWEL